MAFLDDTPDRLETKYRGPFDTWKRNPTPDNADVLLKTIQPEIDRGIFAHVGQPNPLLRSRAKKLALQAVKSYDPTKAKLGTHIVNQLQGLKRVARQQTQILPIPERVSMDQGYLERAKAELADELGREPTAPELADRTGLSMKRINYVQRFRYPMAEGTLENASQDEEGGAFGPAVEQGLSSSWFEFVFSDLDETNQKIMEWTLGLHGEPILSNQEIARKLRITPGAVSQRKARIQQLLNQEDLNPFI